MQPGHLCVSLVSEVVLGLLAIQPSKAVSAERLAIRKNNCIPDIP